MRSDQLSTRMSWAVRAIAIAWTALVALLLFKIGTGSTDIGAPVTESAAIVRTNERLLEMVQWTISTILLVGGGLIGLNWYQNEKRLQNEFVRVDKRSEQLASDVLAAQVDIKMTSDFFIERHMETQKSLYDIKSEMRQTTLSFYGFGEDFDEGAALLRMLEKNPLNPDFVCQYVEKFLERVESIGTDQPFRMWLDGRSLPQLSEALSKANRPDLGERLEKVHQRFREFKPKDDEEPLNHDPHIP